MPKWYSIFEDNSTGLSMMRACLLIIVLTTMFNWTNACFQKHELVPIDSSITTLVVGFAGAKAIQRFGEKGTLTEVTVEPANQETVTKTITSVG